MLLLVFQLLSLLTYLGQLLGRPLDSLVPLFDLFVRCLGGIPFQFCDLFEQPLLFFEQGRPAASTGVCHITYLPVNVLLNFILQTNIAVLLGMSGFTPATYSLVQSGVLRASFFEGFVPGFKLSVDQLQ